MKAAKVIEPKKLGAPLGLYSHGVIAPAGDFVVIAGQVGIGPSGAAGGDIVGQTKQAFANIAAVLEGAGCTLRDVIRFQTFLTRADDIPAFVTARQDVFAEGYPDGRYPPNTLLIVSRLVRPELLVEIEAMAIRAAGTAARAGRGRNERSAARRVAGRSPGRSVKRGGKRQR